jgi:hypothetical protein
MSAYPYAVQTISSTELQLLRASTGLPAYFLAE